MVDSVQEADVASLMGYFLVFGLPVLLSILFIIAMLIWSLKRYVGSSSALRNGVRSDVSKTELTELRHNYVTARRALAAAALMIALDVIIISDGIFGMMEYLHPSWSNEFIDLWIFAGINVFLSLVIAMLLIPGGRRES